jgi:hypothetical protein
MTITNDQEYQAALKRLDEIFGATEGAEFEEGQILIAAIVAYEDEVYPIVDDETE